MFRAQSPQPIVHDPQYSTRIGCLKRPKRLETLSMSIGPFWYCWLLRAESCALKLHTSSKCVFRAQIPQPIVHDPQYSTRIGCLKRPKHLETLSMSIGPFWYCWLATSSWIVCVEAAHILQSVCFEPKSHNRLCTTLNIALESVVSRG